MRYVPFPTTAGFALHRFDCLRFRHPGRGCNPAGRMRQWWRQQSNRIRNADTIGQCFTYRNANTHANPNRYADASYHADTHADAIDGCLQSGLYRAARRRRSGE
jgi:hypothetical protein